MKKTSPPLDFASARDSWRLRWSSSRSPDRRQRGGRNLLASNSAFAT